MALSNVVLETSDKPVLERTSGSAYRLAPSGIVEEHFREWMKRDDGCSYHNLVSRSGLFWRMAEKVIEQVSDISEISDILDVGCGEGHSGEPFIEIGSRLYGIDIVGEALAKAESKGYLGTKVRDILSDDLDSRTYPAVLSVGVIGDYVPSEILLPKMVDVTASGGILAFTAQKQTSDKRYIKDALSGFNILNFSSGPGYDCPGVLKEDYFFVVARKQA